MPTMAGQADAIASERMFQPAFKTEDGSASAQFLGDGAQDISPTIPDFTFTDDLDDAYNEDGFLLPEADAKRRRIARACDTCRKKKIKCDGAMPACKNCINYKTECVFTHVEKKRTPPKGAKYIEALENRLVRMEALLRMSGVLNEEDADRTDLATLEKRLAEVSNGSNDSPIIRDARLQSSLSSQSTPQKENFETPKSSLTTPEPPPASKDRKKDVEELSDLMCSLVTNNCGETRYIGSSSGFSIFSPQGIQWVSEKTGDTSFQEMISSSAMHDVKWAYWKPEVFGDVFTRRTYQALPPKEETKSLLRDFFDNFNCMFPLFHEPTFMHLVDTQYSRSPFQGSGWWASFNVALAISHRIRVMSNVVPQEEDRKAWGFLKNAIGVLTELTMRNTDLLSVQALLGMALFLMGTPNPQPSFFLVAAAIRLAHSIGLHKRGSGFNLNPVEMEQRKRVFWIAYLIDKDICLRSGRPPAQDDDDMNVELPSDDPGDNIGNVPLNDGKGKVNLFKFMVEFAIIESKVYKHLYATKAAKQSDGALLNTIGELDKELEDWKDRIPIEFRPEHDIKTAHAPLVLHVAVMHYAYYNCLMTIHRMSVHRGYWTSRLSDFAMQGLNARPLNPRVFSSATLCVQAARASIQLIRYIPQGDYSCVWLIIYYPVSALVTLFANILQNPQDVRARSDVKLMNQVVNFLSLLSVTEEQGGVRRMLKVCTEFERIAGLVLDQSEKGTRHKRRASKASLNSDIANSSPAVTQLNGVQSHSTPHTAAGPPNFFTPADDAPEDAAASTAAQASAEPGLGQGLKPSYQPEMNLHPNNLSFVDPSQQSNWNLPRASGGVFSMDASQQTPMGDAINSGVQLSEDNRAIPNPSFPTDQDPTSMGVGLDGTFNPSLVPQDLWSMPMTLEWDWANMAMEEGALASSFLAGQQQQQQQGQQQHDSNGFS